MKFKSSVIFKISKEKLPAGTVQRIFTRSSRLVALWAADPRCCEYTARNPIDRLRQLLEEIDLVGFGHYARAAIEYMAEPLGLKLCSAERAASDKGSVDGEIADLAQAVGALSIEIRACRADGQIDTEELIRIKKAAEDLKRECDQVLDAAGIRETGR